MKIAKTGLWVLASGVLLFGLIQLVPYGHDHSNAPVVKEPQWDNPQTRELVKRTCFDCHSNETVWPWYSNVAPVSWLIYRDVEEGRQNMNFSDWDNTSLNYSTIEREINQDSMPPSKYLIMHPEAKLTPEEKRTLLNGLQASLNK